MKIQKVVRETANGIEKETIKNANLTIGNRYIDLNGPRFGFRATGWIRDMSTSYNGSDFDMSFTVLVHNGPTMFHKETWRIKF